MHPRTGEEREVRDAAERCLPLLEERLAAQRAATGLLRPSVEPAGALLRPTDAPVTDQLLRPAAASAESESELLRAAADGEPDGAP